MKTKMAFVKRHGPKASSGNNEKGTEKVTVEPKKRAPFEWLKQFVSEKRLERTAIATAAWEVVTKTLSKYAGIADSYLGRQVKTVAGLLPVACLWRGGLANNNSNRGDAREDAREDAKDKNNNHNRFGCVTRE
eukprot:GHVS01054153.1.p1 GENE.GHVS01054153.1~~GHVS01054153.1.p1  ORF type:complete len:133 (+),score=28.13 GHVS01054153.1:143-541(+)